MWLFPGLLDIHVHLRVPGDEDSETLETGLKAAVAGGVTRVAAMPNTRPPIDTPEKVARLLEDAGKLRLARVLPVACVSAGRSGKTLADLRAMRRAGAAAFSDDGFPVRDDGVLREALGMTGELGCPVIEHPEDESLSGNGRLNAGDTALSMGDPGMPESAETSDVARCLSILREAGGRLHLTHLSSPDSLEMVVAAAASGLDVTSDVTPHHLLLDEGDVPAHGSLAVMKPPLRSRASRERLAGLFRRGLCDAVASDHAPHSESKKAGGPLGCAFGITGLETILPLTLEALRRDSGDRPLEALRLLVTGPSRVLGIEPPSLTAGSPAEAVLFDPEESYTLEEAGTFSLSRNTPFLKRPLLGRVRAVWIGRLVYREGGFV